MKTSLENIYDIYCPMLYSIALQLCPVTQRAEKILIITFNKLNSQNIAPEYAQPFCLLLIKLIIKTAQEELHPGKTKCSFKIKQFENTPLLHQLLVDQLSIEDYCTEHNIERRQALITIRQEFLMIRNYPKKNKINPGITWRQLN